MSKTLLYYTQICYIFASKPPYERTQMAGFLSFIKALLYRILNRIEREAKYINKHGDYDEQNALAIFLAVNYCVNHGTWQAAHLTHQWYIFSFVPF